MKFVDEALITVRSGDGGNGCVSFRREKYVPKGGPDSGDGGKGGDIVFQATSRMHTLYSFWFKKQFSAQRGAHGQGKKRSGRSGKDTIILVPPGTLIREIQTGRILKDLEKNGETFVVACGGKGGPGNQHFASSRKQTPRHAEKGKPGQALSLKLELKLLADVGIIGLPNAGKSTLISKLSSAHPKVADYPFTTLAPALGMAESASMDPFIIADIPGLIEGAADDRGGGKALLGVAKSADAIVLLHDLTMPSEELDIILNELQKANITPPPLLVCTKFDCPGTQENLTQIPKEFPEFTILAISAEKNINIRQLEDALRELTGLIRVYPKVSSQKHAEEQPIVLPAGSTVEDLARSIHKELAAKVKFAKVWGTSAKFPGQTVGQRHVLADEDVVMLSR